MRFNLSKPLTFAVALVIMSTITLPGLAQADAITPVTINMEAGSLTNALNQLARSRNLALSFEPSLTAGKTSPSIYGNYTARQVLSQLLSGSGLVANSQPGGYAIVKKDEAMTLDTLQVEGAVIEGNAYGPVDGYVATHSAAGSKTDTPLIEIPQSISVVTTDQIQVQKAENMAELFHYTSGIIASETYGSTGESFVIRGFYSQAGKNSMYIDGTLSSSDMWGGQLISYATERVELLKGPSSVLYGKSAPGGIINVTTKRPTLDPLHEFNVEYGTNDHKQISADFSDLLTVDGVWSYRLTALHEDSETMIDYGQNEKTYIAPALTWQPNEATSLILLASYQKNDAEYTNGFPIEAFARTPNGKLPRHRFSGEPGNHNRYNTEKTSISYIFSHKFNDDLTIRNNTRYAEYTGDNHHIFPFGFNSATGDISRVARERDDTSDVFTTDVNLEYILDAGMLTHTLLLGADYTRNFTDTRQYNRTLGDLNLYNPQYGIAQFGPAVPVSWSWEEENISYGLYFQDQIKIQDKWVLTLGGRQDWSSYKEKEVFSGDLVVPKEKSDAFTGRVGLVYLADNGLAPYLSYSESFQPQGGRGRLGGRFEPTTGEQYEIGLRYQPENIDTLITAAIYQITQQNVLSTDPIDTQFSVQTGEVRSRGFELEAKTQIGNNTSIIAAYAYTDARTTKDNNPDNVGERSSGVPYNQFSLWSEYQLADLGQPNLMIGAGIRYVGETQNWLAGANSDYTVVDVVTSYETKHWRYAVNIKNLADKTYISACPAYCFFGEERSVTASASYKR